MIDPLDHGTYVRLDALRVGIVDDSAYFRKLAETMLGAFGVRVILQAATEAEALTMVMTQAPDVLLLDWNLGTAGNGAALLDLLRRHPDERVSTLAVTEKPGRITPSAATSRGSAMRTGTRWTILVKLPVALSGGNSENCAPEAGATLSTRPSIWRAPSASTSTSTL